MNTLLWEIGCEEIPARMLPEAIVHLREALMVALKAARLTFSAVECAGTPRRLAAMVTDLSLRQPPGEELRRGPPAASAIGPDGQPSRAAQGFAASLGVAVADLERLATPKGEYLAYRVIQPGLPTREVLPGLLAGLVKAFVWPKSMRWGSGELTFVRPILSLTVLWDGQPLPMTIPNEGGSPLSAGNRVMGHRFMAPGPWPVTDLDSYRRTLRDKKVVLDLEERREIIRRGVARVAASVQGVAVPDEDLVSETACLVEWPVILLGSFDPGYLDIPREVLITSMKNHQKFFAIVGEGGGLLSHFAVVANLEAPDPQVLVQGYQRVLRARLEDAAFFWREDRGRPFAERLPELQAVVYQARLGTVYAKVQRVRELAVAIAQEVDPSAVLVVSRGAELAKIDLVTGMVGEFPELQGVMGGYYALHAGEAADVALAIREHYLPQGAADGLPTSSAGRILALADKLDTLTGCFGIGLEPSGAKDPFALRRAALGVIRMVLQGEGIRLPLRPLLTLAYQAFPSGLLSRSVAENTERLLAFFYARLTAHLKAEGLTYDAIEAVQVLGLDDLREVVARVRALSVFKGLEDCAALVAANKRIVNILGREAGVPVVADRLQLPAELALASRLRQSADLVAPLVARADYGEALAVLAALREPIDQFFNDVLVMDPDLVVRANRLGLLAEVRRLFGLVADISRLVLSE